tara:strand:+ start:16288 stop:17031 length:744 start_codon:yes stop_codon:yes gene_type:complete
MNQSLLKRLLLIVALFSIGFVAIASANTPLPTNPADRWVLDYANVVTPAHKQTMERTHKALFDATGVAIVVVTVPALVDETISGLALRVGEKWGVGRKGEDRGVVIAFASQDKKIFVATGYGVEGYLPDGKVGRFIDSYAIPQLRSGDVSTGLLELSTALVSASAKEFNIAIGDLPPLREPAKETPRSIGDYLLLLLGAIAFIYIAIKHPRLLIFMFMFMGRGGGGGGGGGGFGGGGFGGGGAGRGF